MSDKPLAPNTIGLGLIMFVLSSVPLSLTGPSRST